jgi:PAS domain S-box-containing protein
MNGKTYAYLDLAALPQVGGALLDPRPAFAFRGDGSGFLWANAAGMVFFGETTMGALLTRRFSPGNPLTTQLHRLSKSLPIEHARLEILRFSFGVSQAVLPAACRRLVLPSGGNAVLAIGAVQAPRESLGTRAERLADAIAADDCLAAVLDADGKVLGASGGFADLAPAAGAIDALVESLEEARERLLKRPIAIGNAVRPAGVARVEAAGERLFLLIVGPEEERVPSVAPAPPREVAPAARIEEAEAAEARESALPEAAPAAVSARTLRFFWQVDSELRFTFVSPEIATVVGAANADLVGKNWREVPAFLGFDRDDAVAKALATHEAWSGLTVYWPTDGVDEGVAVELAAMPVRTRGIFAGFRGFGVVSLDDRRPVVRPAVAETAEPEPPSPPEAPEVPPLSVSEEEVDDAARKSIEEGVAPREVPETPVESSPTKRSAEVVPLAPPKASNVVRLPATPARVFPPERLTGTERDAFQRIAEALGVRRADEAEARLANGVGQAGDTVETGVETAVSAESLLDKLPIGVVVYRDRKTLFANRSLLDFLGYKTLSEFLAAGGAEAVFPESKGSAHAEARGELAARRRDGSFAPVEARLHAIAWGPATALMLSLQKRAEAKPEEDHADQALADFDAAEARIAELEAILDTATEGVIVIDERGRIGNFNRSAEALFGVEASDVLGMPFTDLLAEESRKAALDYLDGLASNGVASVLNDGREVIGRVPKGGLIPLFMTMGRLGDGQKFAAVLRDITHWKNVEEELIAAKRAAETANAQKSDFLAKISHEIRTPLNAIIGFSEVMMEERFGPIGNERYRAYLRDIHVSGAHLLSLINDLLDLSKIEAGKLDLSFESVAVNEIIQECVALMQPQANRDRIIIRTSLSAGVPNVVADPRSLRQILLNLLSNAVKFTQAGGQVIVATTLEENGEVVLRVRDTGIGMSEKDLETAMKPFRQIATADRGRGKGTGLGLPLTKALVEANRAAFAIDSVPDQGTLVRITFPTTRVLAG